MNLSMNLDWVELIGYLASALVVASLAMTSVVRLRLISLAGSVTFVVYGLLIGSVPIIITNASIAVLNVWFLSREFGRGRGRDMAAVRVPADSPFLVDFLTFHAEEISHFQPDHNQGAPADTAFLLTREAAPAGVVLGVADGDRLHITLDYVLRAYRDSGLGMWLYGPGSGVFRRAGFTELTSRAGNQQHRNYLVRVGFRPDPDGGLHRKAV